MITMNKKFEYKAPTCYNCLHIWLGGCPCNYSMRNAACLQLYRDSDKWVPIFQNVKSALKDYDSSNPKMDELVFVQDIIERNNITRKDALWAIRVVRRFNMSSKERYG